MNQFVFSKKFLFTKVWLVIVAGIIGWHMYQDKFNADENDMESLHRAANIHRMDCTKTENLVDHTWMTCRYPDSDDRGSVWVLQQDDKGDVWISRNGPAIQAVDRYQKLSDDERKGLPRVHTASVEENMESGLIHLPSVPWDRLN